MKVKGIVDEDFINFKKAAMYIAFPKCDFKCDKINKCKVCQNSSLAREPDIDISFAEIWDLYHKNPLTKGFCCQGLEPFDSERELLDFIDFIRNGMNCNDTIIIYTGYAKSEIMCKDILQHYKNIIIKYGPYLIGYEPHYDDVLGIKLASNNQYAEKIS